MHKENIALYSTSSGKKFHVNDMFVPGSHRERITWLGLIGIAMQDSQYETSNATYLRFEIEDTGNVYIYIFFFSTTVLQ